MREYKSVDKIRCKLGVVIGFSGFLLLSPSTQVDAALSEIETGTAADEHQ